MPSRAGTQVCLAPARGVKEGVSEKAREANRADQEELISLVESGFYPEGSREPWEGSPHGYFLWGMAWRQGHSPEALAQRQELQTDCTGWREVCGLERLRRESQSNPTTGLS